MRTENARLRSLLGLDSRANDGHETAWKPTLFDQSSDSPAIDATAGDEEKLRLLWSRFGARSSVYATRWESASSGKAGWSPATRGGWRKKGSNSDYLPLTNEVFLRHLGGELTVGIYPLLPGDTCRLLVCDFDKDGWVLDALAYLDACHDNGVPAALELSRSGNGAHVWVFFDGPVSATDARAMGTSLLRLAMTTRAELDLTSYDRLFPSQDFTPKAGFGNLIALPLQGECLRRGTTAFLDPTSMAPWPDQWAFLSSIAAMTPGAVTTLAASLRPVDAGPTLSLADLAKAGGPPPPPVIRAQLGGMLSIERRGLPPAVLAALKHLASIVNPEFYEKQRMRFSTWNTPRFISCYQEDIEWLHLPRGLAHQVDALVDDLGSRLETTDTRPVQPLTGFTFGGVLRPQQADAVAAIVEHELGVLVAPPGAGKTAMACAVIAHHSVPTLVIVDRKELMDQWRARIAEYLGLAPTEIGHMGGGQKKPTGVIDVAMVQSLSRTDDPDGVFDRYGLVVVDECHHIPAVSFAACVQSARSRRWMGLTATPYRRDRLEAIIGLQCGPIRYVITPAKLQDIALVWRELIVHETRTEVSDDEAADIQQVFAAVVADDRRTEQICRDVHEAVAAARTCLVLTQRTDHYRQDRRDTLPPRRPRPRPEGRARQESTGCGHRRTDHPRHRYGDRAGRHRLLPGRRVRLARARHAVPGVPARLQRAASSSTLVVSSGSTTTRTTSSCMTTSMPGCRSSGGCTPNDFPPTPRSASMSPSPAGAPVPTATIPADRRDPWPSASGCRNAKDGHHAGGGVSSRARS